MCSLLNLGFLALELLRLLVLSAPTGRTSLAPPRVTFYFPDPYGRMIPTHTCANIHRLSQHHRVVGGGKSPLGPSGHPMPQQGHPELVQPQAQVGVGIPKEDPPQPLWSLCQGSTTCTAQGCLLMLRRNPLCPSLCPVPSVLHWNHRQEPGSALPFRYLQPLLMLSPTSASSRITKPISSAFVTINLAAGT